MLDLNLIQDYHRTMHFNTVGKVVYDPLRAGKVAQETGWAVIQLDTEDLTSYYANQFYKKFGIVLDKPSWEPHISVIKGTYDESKPWKHRDGEIVEIEYSHFMFWNDSHVWLNASCVANIELRTYYGQPSGDRGHITIGRIPEKYKNTLPPFSSLKDLPKWEQFIYNSPLF